MINEQICSRGLIPQTRRNIWCIIRLIIPAAAERSHAAAAEHEHIFILDLFFFFILWLLFILFSRGASASLAPQKSRNLMGANVFFSPLSLLPESHFESNLVKGDSAINSSPVMFSPPNHRKWSLFSSFSAFSRSLRPRCADGAPNYS